MIDLTNAVNVLSAMITPAILILAGASLSISTSSRLARVINRTRKLSDHFADLVRGQADRTLIEEERALVFTQLRHLARRSQLLQRALTTLYLALSVFVATSVAIGIVAVFAPHYAWLPIALGLTGAGLLFYNTLLLILDAQIARSAIDEEMEWVLRLGHHHAPAELKMHRREKRALFGRKASESHKARNEG